MSEAPVTTERYVGFARKWRPQVFEDLAGQDQVAKGLRAEVERGRIGQSYLFAGPRGIGKTTSARIFAKAINCETGPTPTPCGRCAHCREIVNGSCLDVIEIDGASNNSVEQVRDLREGVNLVPFSCRRKIYIIDEVHMLSVSAFNALLKTLEEPPSFVVFIFATTEMEKIPDTIKSRCQIFKFRALSIDDMVKRLDYVAEQERAPIEPSERHELLEAIAASAEGGMRDALVALDQVLSLAEGVVRLQDARDFLGVADQATLFAVVQHILDGQTAPLFEIVRDLSDRGRDLERFSKQMLAFLRDLTVLRCGGGDDLVRLTGASLGRARDLAAQIDAALLLNAMNVFLDLEAKMKQGAPPRILLEFAFARLTAFDSLRSISEVIRQIEGGGLGSPGAPSSGPSSPPPSRPGAPPASSGPAPSSAPQRSAPTARPATSAQVPAAAGSVPLQGGGALEPVGTGDAAALQRMLLQAFQHTDISLSHTLAEVPLDSIEGKTAYFGRAGQPIGIFDAKRFDKPETKRILRQKLEEITGVKDLAIQLRGKTSMASVSPAVPLVSARQPADSVGGAFDEEGEEGGDEPSLPGAEAAAPAPPSPAPARISGPEAAAAPPPMDSAFYAGPPEGIDDLPVDSGPPPEYDLSPEVVRQVFGRSGQSAAQIKRMLRENSVLRERIELAQSIFGGTILDGDGKPVQI